MNKIRIPFFISCVAALLFSVFNIHFALDVSFFAFPIAAIITGFFGFTMYFKILREKNAKFYKVALKLLQYLPYVLLLSFIFRRAGKNETYYWFDVVTVLLWSVSIVSRWVLLYYFGEKRVSLIFTEFKSLSQKTKKSSIISIIDPKRILFEILDWIDALIQAVFMVLLIQIFVFQLYVIPSESMVPSFLIKDRVVVSKISSGPKFPLSDVGLPCLKKYKRGDVIVFRNPHYSLDRKSEVRTVISQIIYMLSFTSVNLNVDENGELKADPLVKRICGLPGEQLVMQDGILYARTKESDEFVPVKKDEKFAAWNLNVLPANVKSKIQMIPFNQKYYDVMLEIEQLRRDFDIDSCAIECRAISENLFSYCNFALNDVDFEENLSLYEFDLFRKNYELTKVILSDKNAFNWSKSFLTDWISNKNNVINEYENDIYSMSNYKLNLMAKLTLGRLFLQNAKLMAIGKTDDEITQNVKITEYLTLAEKLHFYIMILDQRNMCVFPPCDENKNPVYIPKDCYFMMGDNRFNSLDMRHSYDQKLISLSSADNYSVQYYSNLEPQYVNARYILGSALYRFWPLNRSGSIKTN